MRKSEHIPHGTYQVLYFKIEKQENCKQFIQLIIMHRIITILLQILVSNTQKALFPERCWKSRCRKRMKAKREKS